eukprot:gnl/MRDRNA2_/MRDRNA2_105686_c0_seq1.p1 gnl/MRDRNA2_/MRDRNA2_105686_c0~~gnl/MRDRNA2_/MRDRNA2_105686_c0_seq1.p1  ORF type:complete len:221 (-),score=48.14 gnl/MRDRNA2_/MRDRNA2_105686_c0_seq1:240-902(-)
MNAAMTSLAVILLLASVKWAQAQVAQPQQVVFTNSADSGLTTKIVRFLREIEIGQSNISKRVFDARPLVAFAEQAGLHDESVEEIYRQFVEAKLKEAEREAGEIRNDGLPPELARAKAQAEERLRIEKRERDRRRFAGWALTAAAVGAAAIAGTPPIIEYWSHPQQRNSIQLAFASLDTPGFKILALIGLFLGSSMTFLVLRFQRSNRRVYSEPLLLGHH